MTVKIKLNKPGVRELLRGEEMQADLKRRADKIAAAAGPGNEVETFVGKNRARATVRTATIEARIAEETDQSLTRSIAAGRD